MVADAHLEAIVTLYFCLCCGQSIDGPESCLIPIEAAALKEWQDEIRATCQHTPQCQGPWTHAVRTIREEYARALAAKAAAEPVH